MSSLHTLDKKTQKTLLDGVAALSRFFWGPDRESSREILQGSFLSPFQDLKSRVEYEPPDLLTDLRDIINSFANEDAIFQFLEQAYVQLFINNRDGIAAPLYASCYVDGNTPGENAPLMGPPAVMMKKRFESSGLSLSDNMHEPPDHLAIELEYLYFLLEKGWSDNERELIAEAASFASDDMLPWVIKFQERLAAVETECRFYQLISAVLCAILQFIGGG
jgi:TorA-specific chaperone